MQIPLFGWSPAICFNTPSRWVFSSAWRTPGEEHPEINVSRKLTYRHCREPVEVNEPGPPFPFMSPTVPPPVAPWWIVSQGIQLPTLLDSSTLSLLLPLPLPSLRLPWPLIGVEMTASGPFLLLVIFVSLVFPLFPPLLQGLG